MSHTDKDLGPALERIGRLLNRVDGRTAELTEALSRAREAYADLQAELAEAVENYCRGAR